MTVRDLANDLLDMPLWALLVWIVFAPFFWSLGRLAATDLVALIRFRLSQRRSS